MPDYLALQVRLLPILVVLEPVLEVGAVGPMSPLMAPSMAEKKSATVGEPRPWVVGFFFTDSAYALPYTVTSFAKSVSAGMRKVS